MRRVLRSIVERSATFCFTDLAAQFNLQLTHVVYVCKQVAVVQVEHAVDANCQVASFAKVRYNLFWVSRALGRAVIIHLL